MGKNKVEAADINLSHALATCKRFHHAAAHLACNFVGLSADEIIDNNLKLPNLIWIGGKELHFLSQHYKGNEILSRSNSDMITPYLVNAAFSLELHLKTFIFLKMNIWPDQHKLDSLFNILPLKIREEIEVIFLYLSSFDQKLQSQTIELMRKNRIGINWRISELFKHSSNAFIAHRYPFEGKSTCSFIGYSDLAATLMDRINHIITTKNVKL